MTERYFPDDPDLINEVIEASESLIAERLDSIFGAEHLGGLKGKQIIENNIAFRGDAHAEERRELVKLTLEDPAARFAMHVYGLCFYTKHQQSGVATGKTLECGHVSIASTTSRTAPVNRSGAKK
jgi:hypothetical protein